MKEKLKPILKYFIVSILVGLVICLYQFLASNITHLSNYLLSSNSIVFIITIILSIFILQTLIVFNKKYKGYYGGGIPQIEAYHDYNLNFNEIKMTICMFINSLFAFFTCFLLGSEGPSVTIASSIGKLTNSKDKKEDKELVAITGSAGFGCAFLSPLAGLCHLFEENRRLISLKFLFKGLLIIIISFSIMYLLYPHKILPTFSIDSFKPIYLLYVLILGILSFLIGRLFIYLVIKVKDLSIKFSKYINYITIILLILFMILKRYYPVLVGSGSIVFTFDFTDMYIITIIGILLFRLIFSSISTSSNICGGMVLPMMSIGALLGVILVKIISIWDSNIINYKYIFIVCSMVSIFAVVTKTPITAFILGIKCFDISSIIYVILPLLLTIIISYLPVYIKKLKNIYHLLLDRMPNINKTKEEEPNEF